MAACWTLRPGTRPPNRIYDRPLGIVETGFYWDSIFNGTADTITSALVQVFPDLSGVFDTANVTAAWVALKQEFPLLGGKMEPRDNQQVYFTVEEARLRTCHTGEISFREASSLEQVQHFIDAIVEGDRALSYEMLARVVVMRRTDVENHVHLVFHIAHGITDGVANASVLKGFLNYMIAIRDGQRDLVGRLSLAVPSDVLYPGAQFGHARRRWRHATAKIIASNRMKRATGGHILPVRPSYHNAYLPATSGSTSLTFTVEESDRILQNCRRNSITFGNAFPVLGQVAFTRFLCKQYLLGNISEAEWQDRRRQPMWGSGPINIRPLIDKRWFDAGGATNLSTCIGFFDYVLPFMPLGSAFNLSQENALPSYGDLLSDARFLLRANSIRRQFDMAIRDPLFFELSSVRAKWRVERLRSAVLGWKGQTSTSTPILTSPVSSYTGSSFGNFDSLIPYDYPTAGSEPSGRSIKVIKHGTKLHCRPGELYLGASMSYRQLHLFVFWDKNKYDEGTVQDWLAEVKAATKYFLDREMRSRL